MLSALNVGKRATSKGSALRAGNEVDLTVGTDTEGDPPLTPRAALVVLPGLRRNPAGGTERDRSPPPAGPPDPPREPKEMTKMTEMRKALIIAKNK